MNAAGQPSEIPPKRHRRVVHATCTTHGGARRFANLVLSKTPDGKIVIDPHAVGCVVELDEAEAAEVRDQISAWLGSGTAQR